MVGQVEQQVVNKLHAAKLQILCWLFLHELLHKLPGNFMADSHSMMGPEFLPCP